MQATRKIVENIQKQIAEGLQNSALTISFPVLRTEDGQAYLAVFGCIKPENEWAGVTARPKSYCLVDIASGEMRGAYLAQKRDFSGRSHEKSYRYYPEDKFVPSEEYLDEVYDLMDQVRQMVLEGLEPRHYAEIYNKYLQMIKRTVHAEYRVFYDDLCGKTGLAPKNAPEASGQDSRSEQKEAATFHPKDVHWQPEHNLSTVPDRTFHMLERVAEHIVLLETDKQGEVRFEYPMFCFAGDRQDSGDEWQELQTRLANGDFKKARFRTMAKNTIFTSCANSKKRGCLFGSCPYVAAAYIRFLKDYYPERLKEERERAKVKATTLVYPLEGIACGRPVDIADAELDAARAVYENGTLSVTKTEQDSILVEWQESLGPKGVQLMQRTIPVGALSDAVTETGWGIKDKEGVLLPQTIALALAALALPETANKQPDATKEEREPAAEAITEVPDKATTDSKRDEVVAISVSMPQEGEQIQQNEGKDTKPAAAEKLAATEQKAVQGQERSDGGGGRPIYIDKGSPAYTCLNNRDITEVYGHIICKGNEPSPECLKAMHSLLQKKGYQKIIEVKADQFQPDRMMPKTAFLITGLRKNTDTRAFRRFVPDVAIILCASKVVFESLCADPVIRNIYAKCAMREERMDIDVIYRRMTEKLPREMQKTLSEQSKQALAAWIKGKALPDNEDGVAAFVAWQCVLENRLIFEGQERGGKPREKKN